MVRGPCRLSANTLTVKPAGTLSCAPSGFGISRAELLADGVAKGSGSLGCCATAAMLRSTTAMSKRVDVGLNFIGFSESDYTAAGAADHALRAEWRPFRCP